MQKKKNPSCVQDLPYLIDPVGNYDQLGNPGQSVRSVTNRFQLHGTDSNLLLYNILHPALTETLHFW